MNILVTGSNGLIGRNLQEYVFNNDTINLWNFTTSKDADLRIYSEVDDLFKKINPTHVINLAAYVGGLYKNMKENVEFFENNMLINMNVMKCCNKYKITKLVSIMSTCIFPNKLEYPINETMLHDGIPHESNIGYSYSKRMIDILSKCYNNQYGTKFISIIPGNLYGLYDNYNLDDGHVIPSLIHKCYTAKLNNTKLILEGSGVALRQFTYAKDFVKILIWFLNNYDDNEPIIVSNNEEHSIYDVCKYIKNIYNFNGDIHFNLTKTDGQIKKTISNEKLLKLENFTFTNLENGLAETIEWFNNNYSIARK